MGGGVCPKTEFTPPHSGYNWARESNYLTSLVMLDVKLLFIINLGQVLILHSVT